ncbi:helix-turn-helix transcriptional regulator [Noviherbaspirillum sp. UKPF54]|uniref:helix-turn-helix domain-containing protein n=1 Tax=Noviherbaspirillum sp. UKPF54 TaxID=2601898 RepID=UPI0011B1A5DA|nr:helix-turn-helix transcriptional regulator [Noviherbaspirillum sp. UKPF54]QDZ26585.1 helix-turn-helix transcriptional regulator [Noviherbaspirillum sp. UKPF54]
MTKLQVVKSAAKGKRAVKTEEFTAFCAVENENAEERVQRLYNCPGGPLLGWLFDEARKRGHDFKDMAAELGVTYGYINQLRTGVRSPSHISQEMAEATAKYLGCPPIVTKILAGRVKMSDFIAPRESEEDTLDRILRQIQEDPRFDSFCHVTFFNFRSRQKKSLC